MKKLLLICTLFFFGTTYINSQTLAAGDIAFIGLNTDNPEGFTILTLKDIPGSEQIYFTDAGLVSTTVWGTQEEQWLFTAPAAGIPCGTIVSFVEVVASSNVYTITGVSGASMVWQSGVGGFPSGSPNINHGPGDNFTAYQSTSGSFPGSPSACTFIAGIHTNYDAACIDPVSNWTLSSCAFPPSTSESSLPPGLTNGTNCLSFNVAPGPEYDNYRYNGTLTGTATAVRASINNYNNWIVNTASSFGINPVNFVSPSITCAAACSDPDIPTITSAPGTICDGNSALLTINGDKNDATQWVVYTGGCGGTQVATTAGSTVIITPTPPGTTYHVRGEGGCVTPGSCGTVFVNTIAREDATFSYSTASYCVNDADPTPTISGVSGGSFTSSPGGLSLNAGNGSIDVSASTPGTYTVTYTTSGLCAGDEDVTVTINAFDDASFSYSAASYCANDLDPTPTITGLGGGAFSSSAGLSINASTGAIDVSLSTPGTYTVTYTTTGSCPNSSSVTVTINAVDNASFSYSSAAYCLDDSDPTPTITGLGGGSFSSSAGLSINASTGTMDVSSSTPGTYTVTYTTNGTCPNSSSITVTINALDNASFSYSAAAYCVNDADPTPSITGLAGGTYTAGAGLSINAATGIIDVSSSTPGTYTVTYTTTGTCPNASSVTVTINALDDASFSYSASAFCADDTDPTPTITGLGGGTFSAGAGLSLNASTGTVDVSSSTPGTYTITYTSAGACPNSSSISMTINALDDASFSYSAAAYCLDDSDPTPTITGLGGGTFSAGAGLNLNAATGTVDVSSSTPGTYTVTYTTAGTCPNASSVTVTINALDDASFSYSAAAYCADDTDPTPTITGLAGGTFSAGAGLSLNASNGTVDVSISTPGTYTITYTSAGTCPNSSSISMTINASDDASFTYSAAAYCVNDADPTPTITGLAGGTFTAGVGLSINVSTGTVDVSSSTPGTYTVTYTTAGTCPNASSVTVTINALDDASIFYSAAVYCANDADPTPTITGLAGGTFTAGPGLALNATIGSVDLSASTPGTYIITYTTAGSCPNSANVGVTINALDDASFSYGAASYCIADADPTPTITGLAGGTFSAGAGLSINASTGTLDVSASTPGSYTVNYTTTGTCPNSSNVSVTVTALDDASFSYSAAAYCTDDTDPIPTITGVSGGTFSAGVGLSINAGTGNIDLNASTPGTYTITYTTTGACSNSSNIAVTINALDDASFSYSAASYCANGTDPTPTVTGLVGGSFSAGAGLSINAGTGAIDVSTSIPGTYTVSYTTTGACPNASSVSVTINAADDASFSYSTGAFCADDLDPIPTITGLLGGTFSAGAGLSINASSGVIDLSASTVGAYTVTYTTAGACPDSSAFNITINPLPSLNFTALPDLCLDAGIQSQINPGFANTLLAVYPFGNSAVDPGLRVVDPITFAETNALVLTLPGKNITGANGISRNPLTSVVYAVVKIQGQSGRSLVTVNELTGETVEMGNTGINIAGISFTNAGVLYAVSGDGATPSETLYTLDLNTGAPTIVMALGNGDDGEAIAFNYDDGYLYHMSGLGTANVDEIFERIDLTTLSIIPITLSGYDASEVFGMSYAGNGEFIISNIDSEWINVSSTGLVSLLATGTQDMRGHAFGQLSTVVYSGTGVTDDANGITYTFDPAAAGVGVHTITATATNAQGCTNTFTDDVEVFALPVVTLTPPAGPICPNDVLTSQGGGTPIGGVYSGSGVIDDANGMTYSFDAGVSGVGTHTITYTYTDLITSCTDSASVNVSVGANTPPTAACQNISVYLDGAGNTSIVAADIDAGSFDNCGPITLSAGQTMFTCANLGPNNVTLTVTDVNANVDSCVAVVTVLDTISPTMTCPSNQTANVNASCNFVLIDYTSLATSADNCGITTITQSPVVGAVISANTTVTLTADDGNGNTSQCTFDVILNDALPPNAVCQNVTLYLDGIGNASMVAADIDGGSADNCGAVTLGVSQTAFTCADVGANNVTLTVTDTSSNVDSCVAVVTVLDTITPTIICPVDQTENVNAFCNFVVIDYTSLATSADNCGTTTITQSPVVGAVISVNTTVTLTADDGNGNTSQCTFDIILNDATPPNAVCQNVNTYVDGAGNASIVAVDIDGGSTDNCGPVTLGVSQTAFTCANLGANNVTLTATDGNSNTDTCIAVVTVLDTISPTITCPSNQTENVNASCNFVVIDYTSLATSADNCGITSITQSPAVGAVISVNTTVTLTADDGNGNTSQCTFDVILNDATPPSAVCQNITIYVDGLGNASIIAGDIDGGSADNCGAVTLGASQTAFTCTNLGPNNVTLTATDGNSNTDTCVAVVTVLDTISPTITCPGNQTENVSPTCDFTLVDYTNLAVVSDNCNTTPVVTQSPAIGTVVSTTTSVTLTVDDGNGNTTQCSFDVILNDATPPTAVCQNVSVYLDASGNASILAADIDGGSVDNCGSVTISASQTVFTCANAGPNNVVLTVTDGNSNSSICTAIVTVLDTITPMLTSCPGNQTEFLNASCVYVLPDYTSLATATDNCQTSVVISQSPSAGSSISDTTTVVISASDVNGNVDQCAFEVFVSDTSAPVTVCQNITLFLDANGSSALSSADLDAGTNDNCTGAVLVASQTVFTCADVGANNVTLTASDFNGNSSSCVAVVTVNDTIAPVIICPANLTEIPNASCQFTIPDYSMNAGFSATDNCASPPTITQIPAIGTVIGFGVQTITLTADDGNGNTANCSFDIEVVPSNITANLTLVECAGFSININGNTYNTSGVYTDILVGAASNGCDSTLTTDLTILPALASTFNFTICTGESIVINGTVYDELNLTGIEVFTNIGPNSCDSTVSVNLTLFSVDYTVTNASPTLTANQAGASYQWLDCDNGNAVILGETSQSFTATSSGNYAVQVTSGICMDTSLCENVIVSGIRSNEELEINVYPNPTDGIIMIEMEQTNTDARLIVYNAVGKVILNQNISSSTSIDLSSYASGVYLVKIQDGTKQVVKRVLKE